MTPPAMAKPRLLMGKARPGVRRSRVRGAPWPHDEPAAGGALQPEDVFGDDVPLNLVGAPGDAGRPAFEIAHDFRPRPRRSDVQGFCAGSFREPGRSVGAGALDEELGHALDDVRTLELEGRGLRDWSAAGALLFVGVGGAVMAFGALTR